MNKFEIIRGLISQQEAERLHKYVLMREKAARHLDQLDSFRDDQVPDAFSMYGDPMMETYLQELKPKFQSVAEKKLKESYAYCRLYRNGNELRRHRDRFECELSSTMFLGGQVWSIYFEPDIEVVLQQGDAILYKGMELDHWRNKFEGDVCTQVFFHYNEYSKDLITFDGRPMLGVPKPWAN